MNRNHQLLGLALVLVVVFGLFAITVYAQGPRGFHHDDDMPFGFGMHGGRRGMWQSGHHHGMDHDYGWMMDNHESMFEGVAEVLDMEPSTLWEELRAGKNLLSIADEHGVETSDLQAAHMSQMEVHLAEAVENGYLSDKEADEMLSYMQENMTEHLNYMFGSVMGNWDAMPHWGSGFGEEVEAMPCWEYALDSSEVS